MGNNPTWTGTVTLSAGASVAAISGQTLTLSGFVTGTDLLIKFAYIGDNMAFQDTVPGKAKPATKSTSRTSTKTKGATKKK